MEVCSREQAMWPLQPAETPEAWAIEILLNNALGNTSLSTDCASWGLYLRWSRSLRCVTVAWEVDLLGD